MKRSARASRPSMRFMTLAAGAIIVPVATMAGDSVQMKPGRWEVTTVTDATAHGQRVPSSLLSDSKPAFRCISAETATDPTPYFRKATNCGTPQGEAKGGNVRIKSRCVSPNGVKIAIDVSGSYTAEGYDVVTHSVGKLNGVTVDTTSREIARFVGPCRGDESP